MKLSIIEAIRIECFQVGNFFFTELKLTSARRICLSNSTTYLFNTRVIEWLRRRENMTVKIFNRIYAHYFRAYNLNKYHTTQKEKKVSLKIVEFQPMSRRKLLQL